MERLYAHLEQVLEEIDFRDRTQSGTHLMTRIRRFLQRAELDHNEVNILRGILTAVQNRRRHAGSTPHDEQLPPVYLDYAATTPVDPRVAAAMSECLTLAGAFGNPGSAHAVRPRAPRARVEAARAQVAALIGAAPEEILFTSGATESNNLAMLGRARARLPIAAGTSSRSRTEHKAVLDPCRQLEQRGLQRHLPARPEPTVRVDPQAAGAALRPDTVLVSLMHANNEIGVLQDIAAIGAVCRARGVPLHVDAAQSAGKVPLDVRALPRRSAVASPRTSSTDPRASVRCTCAHGARAALQPLTVRRRPGARTAARHAAGAPDRRLRRGLRARRAGAAARGARAWRALRERLWAGLRGLGRRATSMARAPRACRASSMSPSTASRARACSPAWTDLAVSTGAACNSDSRRALLRAARPGPRCAQLAQSSLRFSLGRFTTQADIDFAIALSRREVRRLRAQSRGLPAPGTAADAPGAAGAGRRRVIAGEAGSREAGHLGPLSAARWRATL